MSKKIISIYKLNGEKMSDIRIFKRYEKKYILTHEQFTYLIERLGDELVDDEYKESTVQNIYYDTPDYRLIRESIEKPVYKEKLRLRCYNQIDESGKAYLEIKKKYENIVYKRRERMVYSDAIEFVKNPPVNPETQIGRELAWFIRYYKNLQPAIYLGYERLAYKFRSDSAMRVTFDQNIRWRQDEINLQIGNVGKDLLAPGEVLMEVKSEGAYPLFLVKLFEELKIIPTSYSKYGTAYTTGMVILPKKTSVS
jgi:hypothetical protein